jgi:hypothetical protein
MNAIRRLLLFLVSLVVFVGFSHSSALAPNFTEGEMWAYAYDGPSRTDLHVAGSTDEHQCRLSGFHPFTRSLPRIQGYDARQPVIAKSEFVEPSSSSRGDGSRWLSTLRKGPLTDTCTYDGLRHLLVSHTSMATKPGTAISRACRTGNSFASDTEVVMADGSRRAISELEVGDRVLATDPETGVTAGREVTAVHLNLDTALADVTVIDSDGDVSTINTTQHHPFWNVSDRKWTDVVDLYEGDRLRSVDGSLLTVVGLVAFAGQQWMWDLTIDDIHTFYVANGDEPVLVHNCGFDDLGGKAAYYDRADLIDEIMDHNAGRIGGPSASQVDKALSTTGTRIRDGQTGRDNAVRFEHDGVVVLINEDQPWLSTAWDN